MIRMNDFSTRPLVLRSAEKQAACRVLDSGNFVLGEEVRSFETQWASVCGTRWAVGVGNGMDAIEIGLRALGIGPGDEVITTAMTACATVLAIMRTGATPVLADVDPGTGLIGMESAGRCLTGKTRALLLVHLYGQVHDMRRWMDLCRDAGIFLVEDCAQSHLARSDGQVAGSFGTLGAYSFYPTKNLGAAGDAGAIVTSDQAIARDARVLRDYGQEGKYHHVRVGLNSRLDEIHAAILRVRLAWLEQFTTRRQAIAARYHQLLLNPEVELLERPAETGSHVYHLFVVRCTRRDELARHLATYGIESAMHYPLPLHQQPACDGVRCDPAGLANAERHARTCLSIPCHPGLDNEEVDTVADMINAFR